MLKQAYLIIAHNEFEILQRLVSELDAEGTDIYIHFDAKVKDLPEISTKKSRLFVLDNRVNVQWGTVSQIKCELALFEAAAANGPYDFYHVISGTHYLLSQLRRLMLISRIIKEKLLSLGFAKTSHIKRLSK